MIRHKDITLTGFDVLQTIHAHRQEEKPEGAFGPELLLFMHKLRIAERHKDNCENGGKDGNDQKYRPRNEVLIENIEKFHFFGYL